MAREKKVIDASIVAKWFLDESDTAKALRIRNDHISGKILLVAPELLFSEVLNTLRYKGRDQQALESALEILWDMQLHVEHTNSFILKKSIAIALQYNLTIYDALYAALAQIHSCSLVTADERLKKFPLAVSL